MASRQTVPAGLPSWLEMEITDSEKPARGAPSMPPYATDRAGPTKQTRAWNERAGRHLGLETPWLGQGSVGNRDDAEDETKREEEATAALLRPFWCLMELSIQTREDKTAAASDEWPSPCPCLTPTSRLPTPTRSRR